MALHLSCFDQSGRYALSHHQYELRISASGVVSGEFYDDVVSPPLTFGVNGLLSAAGLVLISEGSFRPGFYAAEFYSQLHEGQSNVGVIASFDANNDPFATIIVLSRKQVTANDLAAAIAASRDQRFYLDMARVAAA